MKHPQPIQYQGSKWLAGPLAWTAARSTSVIVRRQVMAELREELSLP